MKNVNKILFYLILLFSAILTLIPYFVDGKYNCIKNICGFIFGTNYRDGIWFLAVSNVSFKKMPFIHPTFSGEVLRGYHFIPNYIVYLLSKISNVSTFFIYFKLIPILYFVLITYILIKISKLINKSLIFTFFFLFFFYFGIPLTLFTSLINNQPLNNSLLINTFQATRILESPHTAFVLIIIFLIYYWLLKKQLEKKWLLIIFLYFLSFGIKFYGAITLGLFLGIYLLINLKKNFMKYLLKIIQLIFISFLAIIVFLQPNFNQRPTFNFSPFATVHHLIESPNLFYNKKLVLARYFLYEKGFGPRLLIIELYSLFLFVIFYIGTRILGLIYFLSQLIKKGLSLLEISVLISFFILVFLSTFLVQRGDWFNPIQFLVPISYILAIYAGLFFFNLFKKNKLIFFIIFTPVFFFTFVPHLINLKYPFSPARYVIEKDELTALDFLKKQPFGSVFTPINKDDNAYVAAFSGKPTYLNFLTINQTLGINYQKRYQQIEKPEVFDPNKIKVKYFYLPKDFQYSKIILPKFDKKKYQKIYENRKIIILSSSVN